jgi:exodeoxyribonuclease V beta subunit
MTSRTSFPRRLVRPVELDQLRLDASAVVEASAGTGKTHLLEHLVLELIITGRARLDEILIVTFTERATAELVTRIREKIDQALEASQADRPPGSPGVQGWTIERSARARLMEARQSFDQATIATIHSFCQRILTEEPFATRRLLGQSQVDGRQAFGESFRDVLRKELTTDDNHRDYLEAYLASGGSVERLEDLLYETATAPGRWARTTDEPALAAAVQELAALQLDAPGVETLLKKHLRSNQVAAFLKRLRRVVAQARDCVPTRAWGRLLACLDVEADIFPYLETLAAAVDLPTAVGPFRRLAEQLLAAAPPLDEAIAQRFIPLVAADLTRRKMAQGLYDYDDMIRGVDEALDGNLGPDLIDKLRRRYRFALLDEAQDTEPAQWRIFRRVFLDSPGPHPVVLVGDPKQAIYGFRGADVHTYVQARDEVRARGGTVLPLVHSYRSHPEVIAATNAIFDSAARPSYFSDASINYDHPVTAVRPALGDGPGVTLLRVEGTKDSTQPIRIGAIRRALGHAIVREIEILKASVPPGRLSEIFVLGRSNSEAREIAARLHEAGIANALYRPDHIFKSAEARHVRALLLGIADPADRSARLGAWLTPFFDMSLEALAGCADPPADHPLMARLTSWKILGDARAYDDLWPRILDDSGIMRRLRLAPSGLRRLTNYRHLFDVLQTEAGRRPTSIADLAAMLATFAAGRRRPAGDDEDTQRIETEADSVRVMTIHAAKGLEADHVFVTGGLSSRHVWRGAHTFQHTTGPRTERLLCAGKPRRKITIESIDAARHQEDQRLLYVAMTRARKHLYLPFFPAIEPGESDFRSEAGGDFDIFRKISGPYRHVNQRLRTLDADEEKRRLFRTRAVPITEHDPEDPDIIPAALGAWTPAPGRLTAAADGSIAAARLRTSRRGFAITSYSRIKRSEGGYQPPLAAELDSLDRETVAILDPVEGLPSRSVPDDQVSAHDDVLPGGPTMGLFLHAVLEKVMLGELAPLSIWQKQPGVRRLIEGELRRWDTDQRYFDSAARLIHAALTVPIAMPDGSILPGICRAARVRREVDFLFPLPEIALATSTASEGGWVGHASGRERGFVRGFVRGFLDVVFEHAGRVCFADWKSDALPGFTAQVMRAHVDANYDVQVRLYTLALIRMLGITSRTDYDRRFGGLIYLFLRGVSASPGPTGQGICVFRPDYDDAIRWDRELAGLRVTEMAGGA